jgi:hypothetical protein
MLRLFSTIFLLLPGLVVFARDADSVKAFNAKRVTVCQFTYTHYFPGGDMANRFGPNSSVGAGAYFKGFNNFFVGAEGNYHFGSNIREKGIFDQITDPSGFAYDLDGNPVAISAQQRGYSLMVKVGKVFPVNRANQNSGIMLSFGAGYFEHWIRLDNTTKNIAALQGDLRYGYDRLTGGMAFNQFIGYQQLDRRRRINFFAGIEFYQAYTKSLHSYDYDKMSKDPTQRLDILYGLRFGWLLPIYSNRNRDNEFYFQ